MGERDDAPQVEVVAVAPAQRLDDRLGAGERLQAAAVAAAADRARLVDGEVPELAGRAREAVVEPAAQHQPGADPVAAFT